MGLRIIIATAAVVVLGGGIAAGLLLQNGVRAVTSTGQVQAVAAENVYGDLLAQLGGAHVSVTSVISGPNADPHLFAPGTQTGLAVARAQLVVQNGLGYDAFMSKLETAAPSAMRRVVMVADVLDARGAGTNPHLWYDVPRLPRVAAAFALALARADPRHAASYRGALERFDVSLAPLHATLARIRSRFTGTPVAATEPLPDYLLAAAGLVDRMPVAFARAIEEGREPSPQAVAAATALVARRRVRVLLYNVQAVSPITQRLLAAARRAGVPVVAVTETLPSGQTLQSWLLAETRALEAALGR